MNDAGGITEYAAIIIPTLCRYEHLKRCIESLQKSSFAKYTDLYVSVDFPSLSKHEKGYKAICDYLDKGIEGFANVFIYKQTVNLGATKNIEFVRNVARKRHDRFIFSEDDNEFSINFLEYMNKCLQLYEKDNNVIAITGYNYPISMDCCSGNYYLSDSYFSAFGFGTWFDKFDNMEQEMSVRWIEGLYYNHSFMRKLKSKSPNQFCNFIKSFLEYTYPIVHNDNVWKIDLTYGLYMFSHSKHMVFPICSKVRNWGYDGSGTNCEKIVFDSNKKSTHRNFDASKQQLDESVHFDTITTNAEDDRLIDYEIKRFFYISNMEIIKTNVVYYFSLLFGVKRTRKIISQFARNSQ